MEFSLIVPCYNEAGNLPTFFASATAALDGVGIRYELIFVNDGSSDATASVLEHETEAYRERGGRASVTTICLSRNFGKEAAMYAGLSNASGEIVGFIDSDMQQDPAVALKMYEFLMSHDDYDVVAAVPAKRRESLPMRVFKRWFYRLFNDVSAMHLIENASDFRVFRRCVADALLSMSEHFRFTKGMFAWVGFNTYAMPYEVHERLSGRSAWTVRKLFSYAWDGMLAFSAWPVKAVMRLGIVLAIASVALLGWDVYSGISPAADVSSTQILADVVLLMSGLQMVMLGVFGEYMARTYIETKHRPLFVARRVVVSRPDDGCEADDEGAVRSRATAERAMYSSTGAMNPEAVSADFDAWSREMDENASRAKVV